ncbi:MAG: hypothetical protein EP346_05530 [Bacteroidetes bacterium]|nr:MAG: hypothetical protein EP346_05530 [Bacteroidota bacterium]
MKSLSIALSLCSVFLAASCSSPEKPVTPSLDLTIPEIGFNGGLIDKTGNLWLSTNGAGVFVFNGESLVNYSKKDGLASNQVFDLVEASDGSIWMGTQEGLTHFDGGRLNSISLPFQDTSSVWLDKVYPIINPNAAHALAIDKNQNLWIGTGGGGVCRFDGLQFKMYLQEHGQKQEDSLYHNWVTCIEMDHSGNMWFGSMTHGGVSVYNGESFEHFSIADGLSDDMVRTLYCDKSGDMWIGFNGNRNSALTRYKNSQFTTYSDGELSKRIHSICEYENGELFMSSPRGKLAVFDGTNIREFTSSNGQSYSEIHFILTDANNQLWFGGKSGVWKYDGEEVVQVLGVDGVANHEINKGVKQKESKFPILVLGMTLQPSSHEKPQHLPR